MIPPNVRFRQILNCFETNFEEWLLMTRAPRILVLSKNILFPPGYKFHCFYRSRFTVQFLPSFLFLAHQLIFLQVKMCFRSYR